MKRIFWVKRLSKKKQMSGFELFLQLPLFEGVDKEELFSLIPKINLDFESFQSGEVVFNREMEPKGLVYLLKGTVRVSDGKKVQNLTGPAMLSFSGVFGASGRYCMDVSALDGCSVLYIEKKSLMYLLQNNTVFLVNYLDLLSNAIE